MVATLHPGGLLCWGSHRRTGVIGFALGDSQEILAAVDMGGISILDARTGKELARRQRLCAPSGLVRFGLRNQVVVFATHDGGLDVWEWRADELLATLPVQAPVVALATCDAPVVAALIDGSVRVFDVAKEELRVIDVDPRTAAVDLSPCGQDVLVAA